MRKYDRIHSKLQATETTALAFTLGASVHYSGYWWEGLKQSFSLFDSQSLLVKWLSWQCTRLSFLTGTCSYKSTKSRKGGANPNIPIWIQGKMYPQGHSADRDAKEKGTSLISKMASCNCPSGECHQGQVSCGTQEHSPCLHWHTERIWGSILTLPI